MKQLLQYSLLTLSMLAIAASGFGLPVTVGIPSGSNAVCVGATITLADTSSGGRWYSSDTTVAAIDSFSGVVTGISAGVDTIFYSVAGNTVSKVITVNPLPNAGAVTGTFLVCAGATTSLADVELGFWTSSNTAIATVNASTGVVYGVAAGSVTISMNTYNSCGTATATAAVTVVPQPSAGVITGTFSVCAGAAVTLSDTSGGGVWSSTNPTVATIGVTGVVSAVAAGTDTLKYSVTNTCNAATAYAVITVNTLPAVTGIIGTTTVCIGNTITMSDATSGGVWSMAAPSLATVSGTGIVTGIMAGTGVLSYAVTNSCGTSAATVNITVDSLPVVAGIIGVDTVCAGSSVSFTDATGLGFWSSSATAVATINSATGAGGAVSAGTSIISFTVLNGCGSSTVSKSISVLPLPASGTISGIGTVCTGGQISLSDISSGGIWSSTNNGVATVSGSGVVSGVAVGIDSILYSVTTSCGTATSFKVITINTIPTVGSVSGTSVFCQGTSATLSDATGGGIWSSSNSGIATVTSGNVSGIAGGTATISYTVSNGCGSNSALFNVTVNPLPVAGTITGVSALCIGSVTTVHDTVSGGTWSATNLHAFISGNIVLAFSKGVDTILYTVTNSCGSATASKLLTIDSMPNAGTIFGLGNICVNASDTFTGNMSGGVWAASNSIGAFSGNVLVAGSAAGIDTVSYTISNSCGSNITYKTVTVSAVPSPGTVSGVAAFCAGSSITVYDTTGTAGGSWSMSNALAVNTGNVISGVAAGQDTVYYTVSNVCGAFTALGIITVNPLPAAGSITGSATVCESAVDTLSGTVSGGTWSIANPAIATVAAAGTAATVTGISAGVTAVSYSYTNSCGTAYTSKSITVNPLPHAGTVVAPDSICQFTTTTLSDTASGGVWTASNFDLSFTGTHTVFGASAGVDTITYTVTNGCGVRAASKIITINPVPNAGSISGAAVVCEGSADTLSENIPGGTWSTITPAVITVSGSGTVTALSSGAGLVSYTVVNGCGTAVATKLLTVNPLPHAGTITGITTICMGASGTVADTASGGTWALSNTNALVSGGSVTGVAAGLDTLFYTVTNSCGTATASKTLSISPLPNAGAISGVATACIGDTVMLTDPASGGSWYSVNINAAVNGFGTVVAIASGTDTVRYIVSNSCGSDSASFNISINALPIVAGISGTASLCAGAATTLTDVSAGGTWSVSNTTVATVSAAGVLNALVAGVDTVSYSISNSCGVSLQTYVVTVNAIPVVDTISGGNGMLCTGNLVTFTNSTPSGSWSLSNGTVGSLLGSAVLTTAAGTDTLTYSVTTPAGCSASAFKILTVNIAPSVAGITGTATVCVGLPTTLSDVTVGGVWNTSDTSVATVFLGIITTHHAGLDTISYSVSNTYCTASAIKIVTVLPLPHAGLISGTTVVCAGSSVSLSDTNVSGTWKTIDTSVATVTSLGVLSGVHQGVTTVKFTTTNSCGTDSVAVPVTVNPLPLAGSVSGTDSVCQGNSVTLSDTALSAGSIAWSASNASVGVTSSGIATGNMVGYDTVVFSVTNSCGTDTAEYIVKVLPVPNAGLIVGGGSVCEGSSITVSDSVSGGVWTVTNAFAALSSGVLSGISAGQDTVNYSVTNSCGTAVASKVVTVFAAPFAGTISGSDTVCQGATVTLSETATSGVWSVTNGTASIASGIVTGNSQGVDTVVYTVANACGTVAAVITVTVNPLPNAGLISGQDTVCTGGTVSLSETVSGGVWSESGATASIASGILITSGGGVDTVRYTVSNSCGFSAAVKIVTVNSAPSAGVLIGSTSVCYDAFDTLVPTVVGGTWSASNTKLLGLGGGIWFGHATGIDTVSYTVANSCGSNAAIAIVAVDTLPYTGTIAGSSTACQGSILTLSASVSGGVWAHSNAAADSFVTGGGAVVAIAAGIDTVSYSIVNGCGTSVSTKTITIYSVHNAGTLTGLDSVCAGSAITLTDSVSGGVWSSDTLVNLTVLGSHCLVTGIHSGLDSIKYTVSNVCGSSVAAKAVFVKEAGNAGVITGADSVCLADTVQFIDTTIGTYVNFWGTTGVGNSISGSGRFVGAVPGIDTIKYFVITTNSCGSFFDSAEYVVYVRPHPSVGVISGGSSVCLGAHLSLSESVPGGWWWSSNPGVAILDTTGVLTTVDTGKTAVYYFVSDICSSYFATDSVRVNPLPASITGPGALCAASTATLTDSLTGGVWSSSSPTVATIVPLISGTGLLVATSVAGLATVTYTLPTGCYRTVYETVEPLPVPGAIAGSGMICLYASDTLIDTTAMYFGSNIWHSSDTSIAQITGNRIRGIHTGSTTITDTFVNGCGVSFVSKSITVNPLPNVGVINGLDTVCLSSVLTVTDTTTGGVWSSTNPALLYSLTGGAFLGIGTGQDTLMYTVSVLGCASTVYKTVQVAGPPVLSAISGATSSVCIGSGITFTDSSAGGYWSVVNSNAWVSSGGIVTGLHSGTDSVKYSYSDVCGSSTVYKAITVNAFPNAGVITGNSIACVGGLDTLSDTVLGGMWSSANSLATVSSLSGIVYGVATGTDTISYTVHNSCGNSYAVMQITVHAVPVVGSIAGGNHVCAGDTIVLSDTSAGGTWLFHSSIDTVSGGVVTGIASGIDTIRYRITNSCGSGFASKIVTVNPAPNAGVITGPSNVCIGGSITLADAVSGGVWLNGDTLLASLDSGILIAAHAGLDTVRYATSNSCGTDTASKVVFVTPTASAGTITGRDSVCLGAKITLSDTVAGGFWSSQNGHAALSPFDTLGLTRGIVTGHSWGVDTVYYIVSNSCGTAKTQLTIWIDTLPIPTVIGLNYVCLAPRVIEDTLTGNPPGGVWFTTNGNATVATSGIVIGLLSGYDTVVYTYTNNCGSATDSFTVHTLTAHECDSLSAVPEVTPSVSKISLYPNPAHDAVTLVMPIMSGNCICTITDMYGRIVKSEILAAGNQKELLKLDTLPSGTYILSISADGVVYREHLVVER
jgi:Secretion system C-terminal sorting domain